MANFMVKIGSKANYLALGTYDAGTLYFCQDTKEIFKGNVLYTEPVRFVAEFPTTPAQGVLYINTATEEGKVYNGTEWKTVTKKFVTVVDADSTDATVPTSKAVYTAVNAVAGRVTTVEGDVATLKGDETTAGSVAKALADAKAYADGKDTAIAAAQSAADKAQEEVDALETYVGEIPADVEAETVVAYAKALADDAKQFCTDNAYDDTALKNRVSATEGAIEVLNGDKTKDGSVAKQVADAVAEIVASAPEAYDTLKEISDWISTHAESASAMNTSIIQNATDIDALEKLVGTLPEGAASETVVAYISEVVSTAITEENLSQYALASDLTKAVERIAANEKAIADLDAFVGELPEGTTATTVVEYVDTQITAAALQWVEF